MKTNEIIKKTLEGFANNYRFASNRDEQQDTDRSAIQFLIRAGVNNPEINDYLDYYDKVKENGR